MTAILRTALALALSVALSGPAPRAQEGPPPTVLVDEAAVREVVETAPVLGQVVATVQSEVAARTGGVVEEVMFRAGDRVNLGQVLARLDSDLITLRVRNATAALKVAEAGVEVAEARLQLAAQAFERQSQLQGSTAFSRGQFEDLEAEAARARSELAQAEAQVGQAEAELARAEYDLRHATIRAPFGGVVLERFAQPGSYIALGDPVASLIDVGALEIEADLPVRLVPAIREGLEVRAIFDGDTEIAATVRSLLPVESVSTRTRPVRFNADLASVSTRLAAGKSVTLEVPVSEPRRALTVPKDALVQSRGGWIVYTVEDGKAAMRQVELGQPDGERMEILSGLLPGEPVVVRGNERLRDGQPVTPRPVDTASETAAVAQDQG